MIFSLNDCVEAVGGRLMIDVFVQTKKKGGGNHLIDVFDDLMIDN